MPIISDKHVINISFKHIENDENGKESNIDVNAFLEDGVIKVRLKSNNKTIVATISSLKEIVSYIDNATKVSHIGSDENKSIIHDNYSSKSSAGSTHSSSLENMIFNDSKYSSGLNGPSEAESVTKTYASPTIIAMSGAIGSNQLTKDSVEPISLLSNSDGSKNKNIPSGKRLKRIESLNLKQPDNIDDEGRISIDLDDDKMEDE